MANEVVWAAGTATDVGTAREINQDAYGSLRSLSGDLFIVCDGMGGHAAGEEASQRAVAAMINYFAQLREVSDPETALSESIMTAHQTVLDTVQRHPEWAGMGTTVVLALMRGNQAWIANVGDSRAYQIRDGAVRQITEDDDKALEMMKAGIINAEEYQSHPHRGVLTQALGMASKTPQAKIYSIQLEPGDNLLLCTDGVYDCLEDEEIAQLAGVTNPNYAAANIVHFAVERDGNDNATALVARYLPVREPLNQKPAALPKDSVDDPSLEDQGDPASDPENAPTGLQLNPLLLAAAALVCILIGLGVGALVFNPQDIDSDTTDQDASAVSATPSDATEAKYPESLIKTGAQQAWNVRFDASKKLTFKAFKAGDEHATVNESGGEFSAGNGEPPSALHIEIQPPKLDKRRKCTKKKPCIPPPVYVDLRFHPFKTGKGITDVRGYQLKEVEIGTDKPSVKTNTSKGHNLIENTQAGGSEQGAEGKNNQSPSKQKRSKEKSGSDRTKKKKKKKRKNKPETSTQKETRSSKSKGDEQGPEPTPSPPQEE